MNKKKCRTNHNSQWSCRINAMIRFSYKMLTVISGGLGSIRLLHTWLHPLHLWALGCSVWAPPTIGTDMCVLAIWVVARVPLCTVEKATHWNVPWWCWWCIKLLPRQLPVLWCQRAWMGAMCIGQTVGAPRLNSGLSSKSLIVQSRVNCSPIKWAIDCCLPPEGSIVGYPCCPLKVPASTHNPS